MDEKILEFIGRIYEEKLNALLATQETINKSQKPVHQSEQINELLGALSKAQQEMKVANEDSDNSYFKSKYADLPSVVSASRPFLSKNGLSVMQQIRTENGGAMILATILGHSSGQWIESTVRIVPTKNEIQSFGSTVTYLRRYSYVSLIGVVESESPDDDDGEADMEESRKSSGKGTSLNTKYNAKDQSHELINKQQLEELEYELAEMPDYAEKILEGLRIQSLADMPESKYRASITRVREVKNVRSGIK